MKTKKNAAVKKSGNRTRRAPSGVWLTLMLKPKDMGGFYPEERASIKREMRFAKKLGKSDLIAVVKRKQRKGHSGLLIDLLLEPVVIG